MPSSEELNKYYENYHGNAKNFRNSARKVGRWKRKLFILRYLSKGLSFLDVGCNTGYAVEAARQLGFRATGYDISNEAIEFARQTFPENTFHCGTALTAAESRKQYDVVLCAEIIEHLTEIGDFVKTLAALVRPGGILYLTTPDTGHWLTPRNLLTWKEICPPHHLIYFNRRQVRRLLEEENFRISFFLPVLHKPNVRVFARRL